MRSFVVRQNDERKTMKIITTVAEMKAQVAEWKAEGLTIGLTPTMGALHEGHMSLMERAVKECDRVVTSVFVNPIQFGPNEDYDNYPRDLEHDAAIAESKGVNVVFHPEPEEMYPKNYNTYVVMETLTDTLCGAKRPGHFRGVCTVVNKLFNIVQPDKAFFGQKDAQQLAIIKRMVADLNMNVKVYGCPIVREEDGLAKALATAIFPQKSARQHCAFPAPSLRRRILLKVASAMRISFALPFAKSSKQSLWHRSTTSR